MKINWRDHGCNVHSALICEGNSAEYSCSAYMVAGKWYWQIMTIQEKHTLLGGSCATLDRAKRCIEVHAAALLA